MEPQTPDQNTTASTTEPWHAPLNKVTLVSKILAAVVFIILPFVGFWLGMGYVEELSEEKNGYQLAPQADSSVKNTAPTAEFQNQYGDTPAEGCTVEGEPRSENTGTDYRPDPSSEYATYTRQECNELMAQQPMNQCTAELVNREKDGLDTFAQKINDEYLKTLSSSASEWATGSVAGKFVEAQKYWWMSAVSMCEVTAAPHLGGTIHSLVFNSCLLDSIDVRKIELENLTTGEQSIFRP